MRIMITGSNGFVGQNLSTHLLQYDYNLVLTDAIPQTVEELEGIDVIVHLANKARIDPSWIDYAGYYETNIIGSVQLYKLCEKAKVSKFIYASSSSVYGKNGSKIQKETDALCPTNPYAVSKMAAEAALRIHAGSTELIIVRPFTMYGDHMSYGEHALVIPKFISSWKQNEPLVLHGDGSQRRDFIHVADAAEAMRLIINHGVANTIYNIGSGMSVSIKQLADLVSSNQIQKDQRKGHVDITHADITLLKQLGFTPKINVLSWLTSTMEGLKLKHLPIKESQ